MKEIDSQAGEYCKIAGLAKNIHNLTHPGYPGLTMTMSKNDHSFSYDLKVGNRAEKYQIMVEFAKDKQNLTYPGYPGSTMTSPRRIIPYYMSQ